MRYLNRPAAYAAIGMLLGLATVGGPGAVRSHAATTAPKCQSLPASRIPVAALEASYRTLTHLGAKTPLVAAEPRHYGVCGTTDYAFDLFTVARGTKLSNAQLLAQSGHSPVWTHVANGKWVDNRLTSLCNVAPATLINAWRVGVTCK